MSAIQNPTFQIGMTTELVSRMLDNDKERLAEHAKFDGEVQRLITSPDFEQHSATEKLLAIEVLYKAHRAKLLPLERVENALVAVGQALRG